MQKNWGCNILRCIKIYQVCSLSQLCAFESLTWMVIKSWGQLGYTPLAFRCTILSFFFEILPEALRSSCPCTTSQSASWLPPNSCDQSSCSRPWSAAQQTALEEVWTPDKKDSSRLFLEMKEVTNSFCQQFKCGLRSRRERTKGRDPKSVVFSSDLVLPNLDCFVWVVLTIEMHIVDGVLFLHPIVHIYDLLKKWVLRSNAEKNNTTLSYNRTKSL